MHVVACRELQETLDARAGMFRTLSFVAVGQQHHDPGEQVPLVLARRNKLVDDDLRAVCEIAELRFPEHQRFGIVAAETIFKTEHGRFGKRRVVDLAPCRRLRHMLERDVLFLGFNIDQRRVPLIECAAPAVLPCEPHRDTLGEQRTKRQRLGHSKIERALALRHFQTLLQKLLDLGVDVESVADS